MKVADEFLVDLVGNYAALFVPAADHFGKFPESREAIAGHYPLRRIGQEKVARQ